VIDDSDVFSMIVDYDNPSVVFASACSGIYKSETSGQLFHKIQGIPMTARRTRVLLEDPKNPQIVYAGTTEGLYKTVDGGKTFKLMTAKNVIVNDVSVDPRDPKKILLATDRSGVLSSDNGGETFAPANKGYAHRQVSALLVDNKDPQTIYAGLLNDREFGGVFVSHDAGDHWSQMEKGLKDRDVFSLQQSEGGTLWAGTSHGVMEYSKAEGEWAPRNEVVKEKITPGAKIPAKVVKGKKIPAHEGKPKVEIEKAELTAQVSQLAFSTSHWYAAASTGLYSTKDDGKVWHKAEIPGENRFLSVSANGDSAIATTALAAYISTDGEKWEQVDVPKFVTGIYSVSFGPDQSLWLSTHQGALHSVDGGKSWIHVTNGLPWKHVLTVGVDAANHRMIATARDGRGVYSSSDNGATWKYSEDSGLLVRSAVGYRGGYIAATAFNGIEISNSNATTAASGGPTNGSGTR
jgi:photosystem II stability/assembly factor-like uncharacterized protein